MKRVFDILLALIGLVVTAPLTIGITIAILLRDGGPVFYVAERMKTPDQPFNLIKFRTMSNVPHDQNGGVTGGDKSSRITPIGRKLRRFRLDELPQFINVLRGDMGFVGPRPPLRQYTAAFPRLYGKVLQSRPGVTGLASLHYHRVEERVIASATTRAQTEAIYTTRCIPRKAALDLIYQRHASVCFDATIIWQTLRRVLKR
ncbi:putative exopolysaccharide biosynthesis polyprenyl glycosylphosphotransferase [Octadecabacter antarcticus 307]|uniref:Putative exopolysaccharide biosynthesis polyprenyl glycosylphosphotransferase n=1 Tax=Octadecabacter antarcticus 307 TaxID=391626 RepID=M9RD21_9RHOB|nr:sugar transferase [Octadecabacter antarcticus]AGI70077.1 putative exopolysaccharide biosynthesis polyprenyl glycosylphosphotransferase [Octadecabacter antarcticus 307]